MKLNRKVYYFLFLIILVSNFLPWVNYKDEKVSALYIFDKGYYWPLLVGFIIPILGILFAFKNKNKLIFYSALLCLLNSVNFYYLLIPLKGLFTEKTQLFVIHHYTGIGFYIFLWLSIICTLLSGWVVIKESGRANISINKSKLIIGLSLILIIFGGYYYWFIYKPNILIGKVQKVLKKYDYKDFSEFSFYVGSNAKYLNFDGNVATLTIRQIESISTYHDDITKMSYKIRIEDNKNIYIDLTNEYGTKLIYKFRQTDEGETNLSGRYSFWAFNKEGEVEDDPVKNLDDLIYKKSTVITNTNNNVKRIDTTATADTNTNVIPVVDTTLAPIAGDTTRELENSIAPAKEDTTYEKQPSVFVPFMGKIITEKSFFYAEPDFNMIRKGFLVKGQQLNIQKESGDFYYGIYTNFEGKMTQGWMLKKNIEKE